MLQKHGKIRYIIVILSALCLIIVGGCQKKDSKERNLSNSVEQSENVQSENIQTENDQSKVNDIIKMIRKNKRIL